MSDLLVVFCDSASGVQPGEERGERPRLVEADARCPDCGRVHDIEACPKCGADIQLGYGLMFGGMGEYKFCENDECDWFWKREDRDDG